MTARAWLITLALFALPTASAQTLLVSAAASLHDAFEELAHAFEMQHPTARILLNTGASSALGQQMLQGAPVDVFAAANLAQMQVVGDAGLTDGAAVAFAHNRVVVVAAPQGRVHTLADLGNPGVRLVLASPEVPAGAYAREAITKLASVFGAAYPTAVLNNLASEEPNVRQAAAKVALGEADAAFVYATDATHLRGVHTLVLPADATVIATYPIAVMASSPQRPLAHAFITFIQSAEGIGILTKHGFTTP